MIRNNENDSTIIGNLPIGLYYYAIPPEEINEATYLGFAPTIESITYNPFVNIEDISIVTNNFDTDRYGKPENTIPKCNRIVGANRVIKELGEFEIYPNITNENFTEDYPVKLFGYPYRYFILTDYINPPILIKPQFVTTDKIKVMALTTPLSQSGKYNIYLQGYKNDFDGNLEGVINNVSYMLPVNSSMYSQFMASSQNTFTQGLTNSLLENDVTLKHGLATNNMMMNQNKNNRDFQNVASVISALTGGGILNGAMGVLGNNMQYKNNNNQLALVNSQLKEMNKLSDYQANSMANAQYSDMLNTPRALKTTGNDTVFNLYNSGRRISLVEYRMQPNQRTRIEDYLKKFGYRINRYDSIRLNKCRYFTFIKTNVCNVIGEKIPHDSINEIKEIFNKGITFWNYTNTDKIGNYDVGINDYL